MIAFILPAHNEERSLKWSVRTLSEWANAALSAPYRIVISENGSDDGTAAVAEAIAHADGRVIALRSDRPGKGGALKRGMAAVAADRYVLMDVDLSVALDDVTALLSRVEGGADIAVASRLLPGARVKRTLARKLITRTYGAVASLALGLGIRDLQCGCKALSGAARDVAIASVIDDGFFFDTELLARAGRSGLDIVEVPVEWEERGPGRKSSVRLLRTSAEFLRRLRELRRELE